jgi:hypothetical protein
MYQNHARYKAPEFHQILYFLLSPNRTTFKTLIDSLDLMRFLFCMLPLLVSAHDNNSHYEEANISQENQNHWSND